MVLRKWGSKSFLNMATVATGDRPRFFRAFALASAKKKRAQKSVRAERERKKREFPVPESNSLVRESKGPVNFNFISTLGIVAFSTKTEGEEQKDRDIGGGKRG